MRIHGRSTIVALVLGTATVAAVIGVAVAIGQGGDEAVLSDLSKIDSGAPRIVVARVNGTEITRREIDVAVALGSAGFSDGVSGVPTSALSRSQVLDQLIENVALATAAEAAGIAVSDDEVTQTINAGIVEPLRNAAVPSSTKKIVEAALKAMGSSADEAQSNPALRSSIRRFLLANRYAAETKSTREALVPAAVAAARVEKTTATP